MVKGPNGQRCPGWAGSEPEPLQDKVRGCWDRPRGGPGRDPVDLAAGHRAILQPLGSPAQTIRLILIDTYCWY